MPQRYHVVSRPDSPEQVRSTLKAAFKLDAREGIA